MVKWLSKVGSDKAAGNSLRNCGVGSSHISRSSRANPHSTSAVKSAYIGYILGSYPLINYLEVEWSIYGSLA